MSRRNVHVRRIQEVELLRDHWVNGQRFPASTVLTLPATCASNLIEAGAARAKAPEPSTTDSD